MAVFNDLLLKAQVNYRPLTVFQYQITVNISFRAERKAAGKNPCPNELTKSLIN